MHREIPENVDIMLEKPEVHAHGIIVVDLTEVARANQFVNLTNGAGVNKGVIDVEHQVALVRLIDQLLGFGNRCVIGFSTQRCLPARSASMPILKWVDTGVAIATASIAVSLSISR